MLVTMRRQLASCLLLLVALVGVVSAARSGLRARVFRDTPMSLAQHISTSDPANNPLSVNAFLAGQEDGSMESGGGALLETWQNALIDTPHMQQLEQEVLVDSQAEVDAQQQQQQQQQQGWFAQDAAMLEKYPNVRDGAHAAKYEPRDWPRVPITPDPYKHLTHRHGGGSNNHDNIVGALGVQSAAIPWDYRHYSGNLNTHRKAEPLIYTPLVLAKNHDGTSAIDLTSLVNRKYQSQRMSRNPQYANTLSALTDYRPIQLHPTDHWLPQMPLQGAPGVRNQKFWENHFLDLYAPTPPPLRSPIVPRMKRGRPGGRPMAMLEMPQAPLPDFLRHGEHVHSLVTPMLDSDSQPVPFHDVEAEDEAVREGREMDLFAASGDSHGEAFDFHAHDADQPAVFLEMDDEDDLDALHHALHHLEHLDHDTPFPQARHRLEAEIEDFDW